MKQKTIRLVFSLLLAAVLLCAVLPKLTLSARAETYSGECGNKLTWSFDSSTGTLTIQCSETTDGNYYMSYWRETEVPWYAHKANIKKLVLSNMLTSITDYAFKDCTALTSVSLPERIQFVSDSAFEGCTALTSVTMSQSHNLSSIGSKAFKNCTALTDLSFTGTRMQTIDDNSFEGCISLKSVSVPEGVERVGNGAYNDCTSLTTVQFPSTLKKIGYENFIGENENPDIFQNCPALTSITVASGNSYYSSDANGVLYNGDKTKLIRVPQGKAGAYTVPSSVNSFEDRAFYGCANLIKLVLPDGITELPELYQCTELRSLTIPEGITAISDWGFSNLSKLEEVFLPDSLTSIGDQAFAETALRSVTLPAGLNELGYRAFYKCKKLTSVTLPSCTYTSGTCVFQACYALTSLTIPEGCTQIGEDDFTGCTALESITFPSTMQKLDFGAFWGCTALKTVNIPKNLNEIGEYVFRYCLGLTAIHVDPENPNYSSDAEGVLFNKDKTTLICCPAGKTGKYVVPEGVNTISSQAFAHCYELTGLTLPDSLTTIDAFATIDCTKIKSIKIPAGVTTIEQAAIGKTYNAYAYGNITAFIVYGYADTAAQTYAENNKLKFVPLDSATGMADVKPGKYYYNAVLWALNHDPQITKGTDDTHFSPNQTCSRAQVVSFLWNAAGKPEPQSTDNPFADVKPSKYYYKAVLWAVEQGITKGADDTHFNPNGLCSRAQVVSFLWNAAGKPEPQSTDNPFADVKPSKYYYKAVLWAVERGITKGVDTTHFGPNQTCTRGQVVTFLYNAMK